MISTFLYKNKKIIEKHNWKNGIKEGKQLVFYENGNIKFESEMRDGKLYGEIVYYNQNGNIENVKKVEKNRNKISTEE